MRVIGRVRQRLGVQAGRTGTTCTCERFAREAKGASGATTKTTG